MGAFAGIYHFDGRPVADSVPMARLVLHSHATSGAGVTLTPQAGVALHAHPRPFDRLSAGERQPVSLPNGTTVMWDGRLDSRTDLLLTLRRDLSGDLTDAALVAAAYDRWGVACLPRLLGDWALAAWDPGRRTVVLATDYMGNRPLYYRELPGGGLAWATRLYALTSAYDHFRQPDDNFIAGSLTFGNPPDLTPFHSIRRLIGGHVLEARAGAGITIRRWWTYSPASIRYRDPRAYTEQLRSLLTEAVQMRLRADGTVWAHLSGGWDSSSIVCLGHALIQSRNVDAPRIQPLSIVVSGSPESDESAFIAPVERWCGLTSLRYDFTAEPSLDELFGLWHPAALPRRFKLEAPVEDAGDQIVLSGELGDLVMCNGGTAKLGIVESLFEGNLRESTRLILARSRHRHQPVISTILRMIYELHTHRRPRETTPSRRHLARRARQVNYPIRDWSDVFGVPPDVMEKALPRPALSPELLSSFPLTKRPMVAALYDLAKTSLLATRDWLSADVWTTFPYTHRPLVEFILSVPYRALWDPSRPRTGMRAALWDVLPQETLARTTKGNPTAALARASRDRHEQIVATHSGLAHPQTWLLVQRGYVTPAAVGRVLAAVQPEAKSGTTIPNNWLRLEAWLRTLDTLTPDGSATTSHSGVKVSVGAKN